MTVYGIEIFYSTGNSFGSEDTTDEVGCSWTDIDKAKDALKRITEHHAAQAASSNLRHQEYDEFIKTIASKPWFIDFSSSFPDAWKHALNVEKDDGTPQRISAFWCGYFETLYSAEITIEGDSDMKVTF